MTKAQNLLTTDYYVQYQSMPEQRLLSAVIITAMRDACLPPVTEKKGRAATITYDATTAHDFLWLQGLDSYLHYLDIDPDYFRSALLKIMKNDSAAKIGEFTSENRRAFRMNKKQWDALYNGKPVTKEWKEDE